MRWRFEPLNRSVIGLCPGRVNLTRPGYDIVAGHECEMDEAEAARIAAIYPGRGAASCLVCLQDEIADSETPEPLALPSLPDGPEAVSPEDPIVPLAEAVIPDPDPAAPAEAVTIVNGISAGDVHDATPEPAEVDPTPPPSAPPKVAAAPQPAPKGKPAKGPKGRGR